MLRGAAPTLGFAAGTAALGAGAAYGAIRAAGESEGGVGAAALGMLGGRPAVAGGLTGIASGLAVSRLPAGRSLGVLRALLMVPTGIAGAALGGALARRGLEREHRDEYGAQRALIESTIGATQQMFRQSGASEQVLDRIPERYDRSYLNASYSPPIGPFGNRITIGRSVEHGVPHGDDVIAHEFSHKVVHEYSPDLMLSRGGDARAIHETLADTFAMAVDTEDWLVGEDSVQGGARSFSHPERRGAVSGGIAVPAPITRTSLEPGTDEHLAAGVGNKAAWRIGSALGRQEMARIYVAALERRELGPDASYADLARTTRAAAAQLHGAGSGQARVVDDAWTAAGY